MTAVPVVSRRFVVLAGLVAATGDILYATLFYGWRGIPPERILQAIASGVLGKPSFDDGFAAAALGLVLHYAILVVAAAIFLEASRRMTWLRRQAVVAGVLLGLAIWVVMNFVVLPLSAYPFKPHYALLATVTDLMSHVFLVGIPIALITRRAMASGA